MVLTFGATTARLQEKECDFLPGHAALRGLEAQPFLEPTDAACPSPQPASWALPLPLTSSSCLVGLSVLVLQVNSVASELWCKANLLRASVSSSVTGGRPAQAVPSPAGPSEPPGQLPAVRCCCIEESTLLVPGNLSSRTGKPSSLMGTIRRVVAWGTGGGGSTGKGQEETFWGDHGAVVLMGIWGTLVCALAKSD